jgi:LysM repeat protein
MADNLTPEAQSIGTVRTRGALGYARGPLVAGSLVGTVLIAVLILGGIGATSGMTAKGATPITTQTSSPQTEAPPTSVPGGSTPGTDDPVTPPDRDSDQIGVTPPADEIYYIQEGDTLTALSARFGMSIDAMADYNAVRDVNVISEGAVLLVPFIYVPSASGGIAG